MWQQKEKRGRLRSLCRSIKAKAINKTNNNLLVAIPVEMAKTMVTKTLVTIIFLAAKRTSIDNVGLRMFFQIV